MTCKNYKKSRWLIFESNSKNQTHPHPPSHLTSLRGGQMWSGKLKTQD